MQCVPVSSLHRRCQCSMFAQCLLYVSFYLYSMRLQCFQECETLISKTTGCRARVDDKDEGSEVIEYSLGSIRNLTKQQDQNGNDEYQQHILDYVVQWERIATSTIDECLQDVKKLQQTRIHYEKKVEGLRKRVLNHDQKGKDLNTELKEKMNRNELKLRDAWKEHEEYASQLCMLIEEVTNEGYNDMYPLLSNMMKYEYNSTVRNYDIYQHYDATADSVLLTQRKKEVDGQVVEHEDDVVL